MIIFRIVCYSVYTFKNYRQLSTKSLFYSSFVEPLGGSSLRPLEIGLSWVFSCKAFLLGK